MSEEYKQHSEKEEIVTLLMAWKTKKVLVSSWSYFKVSLRKSSILNTVTMSYVTVYLFEERNDNECWAKIILGKLKANLGPL